MIFHTDADADFDADADNEDNYLEFSIVDHLPQVGSPFSISTSTTIPTSTTSISTADSILVRRTSAVWMPGLKMISTVQFDLLYADLGWCLYIFSCHSLDRVFVAGHPEVTTSVLQSKSDNCPVEDWLHRFNLPKMNVKLTHFKMKDN